jgi:hypothetical protein
MAAAFTGCALTTLPSHAQQKYTYFHNTPPDSSRYVREHVIEVEDMPGHRVRIVEIQRTYTRNHPTVAGVKVVEEWFRGYTDYRASGGPGRGYETWILEDGNKVFLEDQFTSMVEVTASGSRRGASYGVQHFSGGTGPFNGIRGTINSATEFDTDPKTGYNRPSSRGEYWLPVQ